LATVSSLTHEDLGSAAQRDRRRRILDATVSLASKGGFDAVQMRAVAEQADVALGTLYRYFPSKIHLLVATMEDQLRLLHLTLRQRPPAVTAPSERVAETLLRAFRALQREPLLADAMVRALIFADRSVSAEVATVSRLTRTIIVDAMGVGGEAGAQAAAEAGTEAAAEARAGASGAAGSHGPAEGDPGAGPSGAQLSAVRVIEHTWHAALVTWLSGRETVAQVTQDIRTVCGLLDLCGPGETGGPSGPER
jgi:AcrR family transcriptional regulator